MSEMHQPLSELFFMSQFLPMWWYFIVSKNFYITQTFQFIMCWHIVVRAHVNMGASLLYPPSVHGGSSGCFRESTGGSSGSTLRRRRFPCWPRQERGVRARRQRRDNRTRSSWPRLGSCDSTRRAWRLACRFWRNTTNSWSRSCAGSGSFYYRYSAVLEGFRYVVSFGDVEVASTRKTFINWNFYIITFTI